MVSKYAFGSPFETEAVTAELAAAAYTGQAVCGDIPVDISVENGFSFSFEMDGADVVYGLGEANRGINKRGYRYVSNCTDAPHHTEEKGSPNGAHHIIITRRRKCRCTVHTILSSFQERGMWDCFLTIRRQSALTSDTRGRIS